MFGELIKLRELGRLARSGRHLEVLVLARDPAIRQHKKAKDAVIAARRALVEEARHLQKSGRHAEALQRVRGVLRDAEDEELRELEAELEKAAFRDAARVAQRDREFDVARREVEGGDFSAAAARLQRLSSEDDEAVELLEELKQRKREQAADLDVVSRLIESGELEEALRRIDKDDPGDLGDLLDRAMDRAIKKRDLLSAARILARGTRGRGSLSVASRDRGAAFLVQQVEKAARKGDAGDWQRCLDVFPVGWSRDDEAQTLGKGLRRLRRAEKSLKEGDLGLAEALASEAERLFPKLQGAIAIKDKVKRLEAAARPIVDSARKEMALGNLQESRAKILGLLEKQPTNAEARDLLHSVDARQRQDLEDLTDAQRRLEKGDANGAREILVPLMARRPDLGEVAILLKDAERRRREQKMAEIDEESRLFDRDLAFAPPARPTVLPARPKAQPIAESRPIPLKTPFIMRVEERGDWFVHPGDTLVIGNSLGKVADLPVLAAIGSRHARIRRNRTSPGAVQYFIEAAPKRRLLRNRRPVHGEEELCHGDVVDLGGILSFTFLRPVEDSESAVLRLDGSFGVRECRNVLLFAENGTLGRLVIGPGPEAHVAMGPDRDRVEVLRETSGAERLLARCPFGVAVDGGEQRPQVAIQSGQRVHTMDVDLFLDQVTEA